LKLLILRYDEYVFFLLHSIFDMNYKQRRRTTTIKLWPNSRHIAYYQEFICYTNILRFISSFKTACSLLFLRFIFLCKLINCQHKFDLIIFFFGCYEWYAREYCLGAPFFPDIFVLTAYSLGLGLHKLGLLV